MYISCGRLIPKAVIFRVEEEIARQLFPNCNITIKIQEKFQLSAQYNLKSLLETYQESILLELKECSPVEYSLFKSANISFPDEGKLVLEVPDTVIAHERCPELVRILEKFAVNGAESRWRRPHITVSRRKIREKRRKRLRWQEKWR